MTEESDKFLTEAMGECWHEWDKCTQHADHIETGFICKTCLVHSFTPQIPNDFITWEGFGKLWEWSKKQEWWEAFCHKHDPLITCGCWEALIDPGRFVMAVFEYLKESQ